MSIPFASISTETSNHGFLPLSTIFQLKPCVKRFVQRRAPLLYVDLHVAGSRMITRTVWILMSRVTYTLPSADGNSNGIRYVERRHRYSNECGVVFQMPHSTTRSECHVLQSIAPKKIEYTVIFTNTQRIAATQHKIRNTTMAPAIAPTKMPQIFMNQ